MGQPARTKVRKKKPSLRLGFASIGLALAAGGIHLWAGWTDAGQFVLHPVGHLTVLAAIAWFLAFGFAAFVIAMDRHSRLLGFAAAAICVLGFYLLLNP